MTGPTTRKMVVNALNSGAKAWMADFEDATSPTWFNVVDGQLNLYDAIRGQLDFTDERGKRYAVGAETPTIIVRPRGWHLDEDHLVLDGRAVPASLVDFGLYLFHNAQALIDAGAGPYFYLPKLESHLEARLWNDVFTLAQERLGIPYGTIRATCLVETTPAAFAMEEILHELRDHSAGLNAGRWDYIFSMIKNFAEDAGHVLPDRSRVTMTSPFMAAYANLLVRTCHARGAHANSGMAAFVPSRSNPAATAAALEKTTADKSREAGLGFDGSWVAHPALVQTCLDAFSRSSATARTSWSASGRTWRWAATSWSTSRTTGGAVTLDGVLTNVRISLEYLSAWVGGAGAVAIDDLMEDAATVEISRMQVWHWLRHGVRTAEGTEVTEALVRGLLPRRSRRRGGGHRRGRAAPADRGPADLRADLPRARVARVLHRLRLRALLDGAEPDRAERGDPMSGGADGRASLTRVEAEVRAAVLRVESVEVGLDLGDPALPTFTSRTVIHFSSAVDSTFVDFAGEELVSAVLNGRPLDPSTWQRARIPLHGLEETNVLEVDGVMAYSSDGEGLHRHVDPADGQTYLYAMSFLDAAPRWYACFDQPDLKARHDFVVAARQEWTVLGNGPAVLEPGRGGSPRPHPLSTYFDDPGRRAVRLGLRRARRHPARPAHPGVAARRARGRGRRHARRDRRVVRLLPRALRDALPVRGVPPGLRPRLQRRRDGEPRCVTFRDAYVSAGGRPAPNAAGGPARSRTRWPTSGSATS